jgi:hypothetical protein
LIVDVVTRQELFFIAPTSEATALQCVMKPTGEEFVGVAVAYKARVKLNRLASPNVQNSIKDVGLFVTTYVRMIKPRQLDLPIA